MTAYDFVQTIDHPVLRFASTGTSAGVDVALLDDTALPFDLDALDGDVDLLGHWCWSGDVSISDWQYNDIIAVWIRSDREEYERQRLDYESSM